MGDEGGDDTPAGQSGPWMLPKPIDGPQSSRSATPARLRAGQGRAGVILSCIMEVLSSHSYDKWRKVVVLLREYENISNMRIKLYTLFLRNIDGMK